jgi:antitoxin HicB
MIPADDGMVLVAFPDVPEAIAAGDNEDEALARAPEVLEVILAYYVAEGMPIPKPSDICGAPRVATQRFSL